MCSTYVRLVSVDKDEFNRTLLVCIMLYLKLFRLILQGRSSFNILVSLSSAIWSNSNGRRTWIFSICRKGGGDSCSMLKIDTIVMMMDWMTCVDFTFGAQLKQKRLRCR